MAGLRAGHCRVYAQVSPPCQHLSHGCGTMLSTSTKGLAMERIKTDGKWEWVGTCARCGATKVPVVDVYGPSEQVGVVQLVEVTKQCQPCSTGSE